MRKAQFWGFLEISSCLGGPYRPIKWHSKNPYFTEKIWNFKSGEPKFDFLTRKIIRIVAVWLPSVLLTIWNWFRCILKHIMKIPKQKIPDFSKKLNFGFLLDHFDSLYLSLGDPNSLENPRNELFASSRYFFKKISSKNIKFSKSYDHPKLVLFFPLYCRPTLDISS